jgi:hypothetical protein
MCGKNYDGLEKGLDWIREMKLHIGVTAGSYLMRGRQNSVAGGHE